MCPHSSTMKDPTGSKSVTMASEGRDSARKAALDDEIESAVRSSRSFFSQPRHTEPIVKAKFDDCTNLRLKDRMKTMSVAVVMCLNVGCDPPDICKPSPCAVKQCWIDPFTLPQSKASETIARELIKQYERWQPRAKFKSLADPTIEDVKKLTTSLRRSSKEERVLFHYNGHGVPQPTVNGEIWVFNKTFTQYIPLSLYDLHQWMGNPSIYVFDCSNGGVIWDTFETMANQHESQRRLNRENGVQQVEPGIDFFQNELPPEGPNSFSNLILLTACDKGETLPFEEGMPADLFTSCLTTPIKTFIVWFIKSGKAPPGVTVDIADRIPGLLSDRKTTLGELNWIFTAITDTIAWNSLPKDLFQRLFRQDLLVASLFRNFLLAQRIMRSFDCTPISFPKIVPVHSHPLWASWDLAVTKCLMQLHEAETKRPVDLPYADMIPVPHPTSQNQFFAEQLTAFQVWLKVESVSKTSIPQQLPIILQVLLSQAHRSRALDLLGHFLNLGPTAVDHAISVGISPYVLKLLQTNAREVRPFLVFIWAKILAISESFQTELIRDNAHLYFMNVLADSQISLEHQIMSAFVLSVIVRRHPNGQNVAVKSGSANPYGSLIEICLHHLIDHQQMPCSSKRSSDLRKWLLISLGNVWENNEEVRWLATRNSVYEKIFPYLEDQYPEVRTAAVFALGTFINSVTNRNDQANDIDQQIVLTLIQKVANDSSPLVRREFLVTLQWFVLIFEKAFFAVIKKKEEDLAKTSTGQSHSASHSPKNSVAHNHNPSNALNISIDSNSSGNSHNLLMTAIRKLSSRDTHRLTPTSNIHKLLPIPMSITVPSNLSSAGLNMSRQFTPPNGSRVASSKSLSERTSCITNIYSRVCHVLEVLRHDPDPSVSKMANVLVKDLYDKYHAHESVSLSSQSNSPNNRSDFLDSNDSTRSVSRGSHNEHRYQRRSSSMNSYTANGGFPLHPAPKRTVFGKDPNSFDESDSNGYPGRTYSETGSCRRPLITTSFVDWCTSHFARPGGCDIINYDNLEADLGQEWKVKKLTEYYRKAKDNLTEKESKIETCFLSRTRMLNACNFVFHPFEKAALFSTINDLCSWNFLDEECNSFSNENAYPISDIALANTHDMPLAIVATEGGAIKIWRNLLPATFSSLLGEESSDSSKPSLVSAFTMFEDFETFAPTKLFWQPSISCLYAAGGSGIVRLWDAEYERKIRDIQPDMTSFSSISGDDSNMILLCGDDGYLKFFDHRIGEKTSVSTIKQFTSTIVGAGVWSETMSRQNAGHGIVCGTRDGNIFWFDRRNQRGSVHTESLVAPLTAMAFHPNAPAFACSFGRLSDVCIFGLDGSRGKSLKQDNEIRHMSFHPLEPVISLVGTDGSVRVIQIPLQCS